MSATTNKSLPAWLLDENNPHAERFLGMGFTLGDVKMGVDETRSFRCLSEDVKLIDACFRCVCGRTEYFQGIVFPEEQPSIYELFARAGALSRDHLLGDGYTEEQINDMELRLEVYRWRKAKGEDTNRPVRAEDFFEARCRAHAQAAAFCGYPPPVVRAPSKAQADR